MRWNFDLLYKLHFTGVPKLKSYIAEKGLDENGELTSLTYINEAVVAGACENILVVFLKPSYFAKVRVLK